METINLDFLINLHCNHQINNVCLMLTNIFIITAFGIVNKNTLFRTHIFWNHCPPNILQVVLAYVVVQGEVRHS